MSNIWATVSQGLGCDTFDKPEPFRAQAGFGLPSQTSASVSLSKIADTDWCLWPNTGGSLSRRLSFQRWWIVSCLRSSEAHGSPRGATHHVQPFCHLNSWTSRAPYHLKEDSARGRGHEEPEDSEYAAEQFGNKRSTYIGYLFCPDPGTVFPRCYQSWNWYRYGILWIEQRGSQRGMFASWILQIGLRPSADNTTNKP